MIYLGVYMLSVYTCLYICRYMCLCFCVLSAATWAQLSKPSHQLTAFSATEPCSHELVLCFVFGFFICVQYILYVCILCTFILQLNFTDSWVSKALVGKWPQENWKLVEILIIQLKTGMYSVYEIRMHQFEAILNGKVSANISFNCGLNLGLTVVQVGSSVGRTTFIRVLPPSQS